MNLELKNKIAIITGASKGIGNSIARILSAEGMKLTLVARSALDEFSASLPTESLPLSIDMRHADSAARVVDATLERFGALDLLVNNAGATKRGDFLFNGRFHAESGYHERAKVIAFAGFIGANPMMPFV